MRLSKAGYYADFVVYPLLLLPLGVVALRGGTSLTETAWALAGILGFMGYSLLEYVLHRFVLHHVRPFRALHDLQRAAQGCNFGVASAGWDRICPTVRAR